MIRGFHPILQGLLGTIFTWAVTALGAAVVFCLPTNLNHQTLKKILDGSLGFAAGVMVAASYWSLLAPAIDIASDSGVYGTNGEWAFIPVSIGLILGALFVYGADKALPQVNADSFIEASSGGSGNISKIRRNGDSRDDTSTKRKNKLRKRHSPPKYSHGNRNKSGDLEQDKDHTQEQEEETDIYESELKMKQSWRRILLLVLAITVHNFPEGLAVGVGFGATPNLNNNSTIQTAEKEFIKPLSYTFEQAQQLAIGIGLQNFPEGLAVSLPLVRLGYSPAKSFWYGQLSGMVEPIGGLLGAAAVQLAAPCLPYTLAFAAGAMLYVVVQELIPESHESGNPRLSSAGFMCGFIVMMSLDVALG